jgi:hypothetical protein
MITACKMTTPNPRKLILFLIYFAPLLLLPTLAPLQYSGFCSPAPSLHTPNVLMASNLLHCNDHHVNTPHPHLFPTTH